MVATPLNMRYVYKRERGLERKRSLTESARIPDLANNNSENSCKYKLDHYITECSSYTDAISLLETLYNDNHFYLLEATTQKVIDDIIPMVESAELPNCISYIQSSNIGDVNKDRLIETAKIYKSVDRIRKNHKNLSKVFEMSDLKYKSDKERCFTICSLVDTHNLSRFIKFNVALEELTYLSYTEGFDITDSSIARYVTEYFLMIDENTQDDIDSYKRAITSSKVLSESAGQSVKYLLNNTTTKATSWKESVDLWRLDPNKKIDTLVELARTHYSDINVLNEILSTIDDFVRVNDLSFDKTTIFTEFDTGIDKDAASNILSIIKESGSSDADYLVDNLRQIWEAEVNDEVYIGKIKTPMSFTSSEIDKFKMYNMVVDAKNAGEFLDQVEKTSMKELPISIERILSADDTDLNESNLLEHVSSDGYLCMKLRSYTYSGSIEEAYKLLESSINCINNILYGRDSKAYYSIGENHFDISIRSRYKIILSEAQEVSRGVVKSDRQTIYNIDKYVSVAESLYNSKLEAITEKLLNDRSYAAEVTPQEAAFIGELLSPYLDRNNNIMEEFAEICKQEANPKYDRIKQAISNIDEEAFDLYEDHDTRINFCAEFLGLNEGVVDNINKAVGDLKKPFQKNNPVAEKNMTTEKFEEDEDEVDNKKDTPKKEDKKPDEDDIKSSSNDDTQKAINSLNDAKLAWQGVKSKLKGASAKEQEMSRDLDLEFNHMLKIIKNTYGRDYREEIITGEVNHSLSKIIKIGIALAGIGVAAHSAVIPVIAAVALFAKSKHTSNKEKKMILDEIDIELKVLEREIQRAESSGSTKKYRQLLTIEKNLQRKRQEIYYGLAKKGQRVPLQSTTGLRTRE